METSQTLIDSLTDHLALFHSSRARNADRNPNSIQPRASILRWFSSLSVSGRGAALTVLDRDLISVLFNMLSYLHRHGHCFFFLLTDSPSSPSVLYRRSRGFLARAAAGHVAETELGDSILLFSSGEFGSHEPDAVTVSEKFVSDIDRFVEVMDAITGGRFLTGEENIGTGKAEKWPEMAWLKDKGYYSLESYIANRLEIALIISWREANGGGGRKGKGGKGVKDKAVAATSGMAANVFWRKKGCLDWWDRLDQRQRHKALDAFVGKASRTMAEEIVKETENFSKKKLLFFNHLSPSCWETTKQSFFKRSRYSITSDDISLLSYKRNSGPPLIINKLVVLHIISLLKREVGHYGENCLFFTTLAMAGSISDYVLYKLRKVLMDVSVECTNLELLEDFGTSKSNTVVQNKGKKNSSKPRKPKSGLKSSKDNKLEGANNNCPSSTKSSKQSKTSCVIEEPKGSLSTLPLQETCEEMLISGINKETEEASIKNKSNPAKKKNKRKGKNKTGPTSEVKNQQSNRAKKPVSDVNVKPLNTKSIGCSKEWSDPSQVYNNPHNFSNPSNGTERENCLNVSCIIDDLTTENNIVINKRVEQETEQIGTSDMADETLIPPITPLNLTQDVPNPTLDLRNPFWEGTPANFDMPFAPTPQHVLSPPLALPLSYDWPPVYRSYNSMTHNFSLAHDFIDDSEAYYLSEEEMDYNFPYSERGYNQFFGGGVMYWSSAEYGSGNGNGSYCSDDSAWAWHEADVNRVIEEMSVLPSPSPSPSPSTRAASIAGSDNGLEDSKPTLAPVKSSATSSCGDTLPYMLRPINVPNGITRRGSRSELKPGQEYHRSPCIPSSARREPSRVKRPPSPVVLCVPRVPRPPPPSPVGEFGRRRAGGLPVARSGSSSPRNWGMRGVFSEEKGNLEKGQVLLDGPEVVWPKSALTMMQPFQGTPVLQEHLMKITQFSRDQQHPDIALPLQPPNSTDCDSRLVMNNLLHEEIDYFYKQVSASNLTRKPYITWAVNRVTRCLQVLWPRSRTSLFGSNATGLALPTSDVDLVISLPPVRNLEPIKEAGILEGRNGIKETCLQHAARHLLNQEWVRSDSLKTVENTAIPVIMLEVEVPSDINLCNDNPLVSDNLQEAQENILREQGDIPPQSDTSTISKAQGNCAVVKSIRLDISFKSPSHTGLQTSELVRELIQQFPASVPLALVLKKFLADRSLDHSYSGGLSSYCLVLLITRFLQHEHHLGQPVKQNLGILLMDFLYFFGNVFDPRQMRISIRGSGLYLNRERGLSIDPIHIDDPLYPANNVGRNCFRIHQCIKAFADAFSLLESETENLPGDDTAATTASKFRLLRKIIPTIDCDE
ncbi:Non-canonical poly(A) RNA polymerase PAPD5 [Rhynchospora pubera]|uniref:Non-canonical poly(A) RNA polymerase PAPD5 n=1 Tax=Rhynchospora pubera TaxID=906938 RepID=A0AAV8GIM5_9POAL|nr:Non-canonical poly(A) RNA polymerase PAPD5 [Rhynchospora pubera]